MAEEVPVVVNAEDAEEQVHKYGRWGGTYKVLTPSMRPRGGSLGVNLTRVSPGMACVPFHAHAHEDEAFYILSGRGVLRYRGELTELRPGDCISCPANVDEAHQIANPYDEDLTYLSIGKHDPHEVCVYPDSGKVMVRSIGTVGHLEKAGYFDGEPEVPAVFGMIEASRNSDH